MEITPTNQTAAAAAAATARKKPEIAEAQTSSGALAGDFDTFLKLLTAQMQNQDPLEPMDNTEFVAQLASFSSVEQQIRTNDQLVKIFDALGGNSPAGLSNWIGKEVLAPVRATYSGAPIDVAATAEQGADAARLLVSNDFGQVVAERTVDPKATSFAWDGRDALGNALPNGAYSFQLASYRADEMIGTTPGEVYARVSEVRIADDAPTLVLDGGQTVAAADVSGLR